MGKRRKKRRPRSTVSDQYMADELKRTVSKKHNDAAALIKEPNETVGVQRNRGKARHDVVLSIVYTDSTFVMHADKVLSPVWVGACIHCRRKIAVTESGATCATIEHVIPKCAGGSEDDPKNLALACAECNHEKGRRHDKHVGKGGRADDVITALQGTRLSRWREPVNVA